MARNLVVTRHRREDQKKRFRDHVTRKLKEKLHLVNSGASSRVQLIPNGKGKNDLVGKSFISICDNAFDKTPREWQSQTAGAILENK